MLAIDIMTPNPTTVRAIDTAQDAIDLLHSMNVRHLPVVNEQGQLVGMLSDRDLRVTESDLLRDASASVEGDVDIEYENDDLFLARQRIRVGELMSTAVICVEGTASLSEVVEHMINHKIGAVPVVDHGFHPIGIVSYIDVLRLVAGVESSLGPTRAANNEDGRGTRNAARSV